MNKFEIILIVALFSLSACAKKSNKHKIDPAAIKLNYLAMDLYIHHNNDSISKAIKFLDSATTIDSNYFLGYYDKLVFLNQLRRYDEAIIAIKNIIRLRPDANDFYLMGGIFYEKIGDTVSSRNYFQKSLAICTKVLDTMNVKNIAYSMLVINKAINQIMLGQQTKGDLLLKQIYENQTDSSQKEWIHLFINKNKYELIELFNYPPTIGTKESMAVEVK